MAAGRPRIHNYWIERIKELHGAQPRSAKSLQIQLQSEYGKLTQDVQALYRKPPSDRAISRFLKDWELPENDSEREQYRLFSWPQSMESGFLPWEASRTMLDLLDFLRRKGVSEQPLNRNALWLWHVTIAAADLPLDRPIIEEVGEVSADRNLYEICFKGRWEIACYLATLEVQDMISNRQNTEPVEAYFAYAPWRSRVNAERYLEAIFVTFYFEQIVKEVWQRLQINPEPSKETKKEIEERTWKRRAEGTTAKDNKLPTPVRPIPQPPVPDVNTLSQHAKYLEAALGINLPDLTEAAKNVDEVIKSANQEADLDKAFDNLDAELDKVLATRNRILQFADTQVAKEEQDEQTT